MQIHKGHFERLREKFEKGALEEHEVIELLLHYVIPRVNTNERAHALINSSGGIARMFERSPDSLCRVEGIGPKSAEMLRLVSEVIKLYILDTCDTTALLRDSEQLHNYLRGIYVGAYEEEGFLLMFKGRNKFLGYESIGKGMRTEGVMYVKRAVRTAQDNGAEKVVIAHNHPDGIAVASDIDIQTAERLDIAFGNAGIKVIDQFVVADGKCISVGVS